DHFPPNLSLCTSDRNLLTHRQSTRLNGPDPRWSVPGANALLGENVAKYNAHREGLSVLKRILESARRRTRREARFEIIEHDLAVVVAEARHVVALRHPVERLVPLPA